MMPALSQPHEVTRLTFDTAQPGFARPGIAEVASELDRKLSALLEALDVPAPQVPPRAG